MVESTANDILVSFRGIQKSYDGESLIVRDLNLDIRRGEFLTLLGPSGSGKTTSLMMLAGFETPTAGEILLDGRAINNVPPHKRDMGMVFQNYALFPHMTVSENLAFPLSVRGMAKPDIKERVKRALAMVQLEGFRNRYPAQLSGGQQQRVALARALVFEPPVLLLDEPFSALDKHLRGRMQEEVARLHGEFGTTFVFVTHDQSEALSLSSRIAIFNHGRLLQVGAPRDIYERPSSRFVAEFLGEINLLPVEAIGHCARGTSGLFEDARLTAPRHEHLKGSAVLAVRPEHMSVSAEPPAEGNGVPARLAGTTYLGSAMRLAFATRSGTPLTVTLPSEAAGRILDRGPDFWVTWSFDNGFLLPEQS